MAPLDTLGRPVRDLRISVTDRCNFRCQYCMPRSVFGHDYRFMDRKELLTFEELERVAQAFVRNGVEKIRITGGEPLLRRDLESLVERLARSRAWTSHSPPTRRCSSGRRRRSPRRDSAASTSASTASTTRRSGA